MHASNDAHQARAGVLVLLGLVGAFHPSRAPARKHRPEGVGGALRDLADPAGNFIEGTQRPIAVSKPEVRADSGAPGLGVALRENNVRNTQQAHPMPSSTP